MGKICKHQEVKRWDVKRPFKGILIGLVSEKDTTDGTIPTISQIIDPAQVYITVNNRSTNIDVYNGTLQNWYRFLKCGDRDLVVALGSNTADRTIAITDDKIMQEMNLLFDTYDGDYQILIDMRESVPAGSRDSSYLVFNPIYSDDAMTHEVIYVEKSLSDDNFDEQIGSGIEEIQVYNETSGIAAANMQTIIKRIGYRSTETSEQYDAVLLELHNASFEEAPNGTRASNWKLHDGEILTNCSVYAEVDTDSLAGNKWKLMYRKLLPNPNAEASIAKRDNRIDYAYDAVENPAKS